MKVVKTEIGGICHMDVISAVEHALYPDAYTYEDQIGKLQKQVDLQSELIALLVDKLCENGHIKTAQLEEILGYGYEVRMD